MADVFISYSKADRSYALDLADELRVHGISVWIDQTSIRGAKNWASEIVTAIDDCSTLLCLLSPHSITSHNFAKEIHLASEKQKHILPVVIETVTLPPKLEYPLAGLQRVFFRDRPSIFQALDSLCSATEVLPDLRIAQDDMVRIAVLPFDDLSPHHDNQWFADGMMDELISTLGGIEQIKVPPRSDVLHYRDHKKRSRDIAREVGVRYLIEGGVRKANNRIRINASLTDSMRGEQLWTHKFDGSFEDVFAFQEAVSKSIVEALKLRLAPKEIESVEMRPTHNSEAYELYLKGRHEHYYLTKESYLRALDLYEQAAALDPAFAQAYINIASLCCSYYREYSKNPKWLKRAEVSLGKAFAITGETSRTLMIRGMIEWLRGHNEAAIETLAKSGALDPTNDSAFSVLGSIYTAQGNYLAARDAFERAVDIAANAGNYFNFLNALDATGEKEKQMRAAQTALPIFEQYLLREPEDPGAAVSCGFVLYWAGNSYDAERAAEALFLRDDLSGATLYDLGCLLDNLGRPECYIELLRKAIQAGYREVEQTRSYTFRTIDPTCEQERNALLIELDALIELDKKPAAA